MSREHFTHCHCPCKGPLPADAMAGQMYIDRNHAQRAYRERVKDAAAAVGLTVAPSFRAIAASTPTRGHNGDAEKRPNGARRARSGIQVSYPKAVAATTAALVEFGVKPWQAPLVAERALADALSARQRERLEARR